MSFSRQRPVLKPPSTGPPEPVNPLDDDKPDLPRRYCNPLRRR